MQKIWTANIELSNGGRHAFDNVTQLYLTDRNEYVIHLNDGRKIRIPIRSVMFIEEISN